jgi:uncharacterized integral membrane protein
MAQWLYSGLSTVMNKVLLTVIPAVWVVAMAIASVQNATPIRLKFFAFESVELPFGVVLSFCVAVGMVIGAVAIFLWGRGQIPSASRSSNRQ